ncbi:hypothetical protein MMC13_004267 [Lambiella insularis]|nr:hypothetical protein [Lambiella insularis]
MTVYRAGSRMIRYQTVSCYTASPRVTPLLLSLQRVSVAHNTFCNEFGLLAQSKSSTVNVSSSHRAYATRPASRPKAHTGRITTSPRGRKPKAAAIVTAETAETGPLPAIKSKSKAKSPSKKPKAKLEAKAKAKAKPKVKAKKAAPKRKVRARKPLTEEGIGAAAAKEKRKHVKELRILALSPPKLRPATAYTIINQELAKEQHALSSKESSQKYRHLIPEELEHYNHIAHQNKGANQQAYHAWIQSLTPDEIRKANNARNQLTRLGVKGYSRNLKDERQVKRPVQAHSFFLKDRFNSGDMHGMALPDATRLITREWRELDQADKQKYYDSQAQSQARYAQEVKDTYHRTADLSAITPAQAATAPAA